MLSYGDGTVLRMCLERLFILDTDCKVGSVQYLGYFGNLPVSFVVVRQLPIQVSRKSVVIFFTCPHLLIIVKLLELRSLTFMTADEMFFISKGLKLPNLYCKSNF